MNQKRIFQEIYRRLSTRYGPQQWWASDTCFEMILGAILTQSTSWTNADQALNNLRRFGVLDLHRIGELPADILASLLRPSGYFNQKAFKVKAFVDHLRNHYNHDLRSFLTKEPNELRTELLSIYGIGEETADNILLYAAGEPFFVIDAYTKRILRRIGIQPQNDSYGGWQSLFHNSLIRDAGTYNEYHALLVAHGKETCQRTPKCKDCCILDLCTFGSDNIFFHLNV